MNKTSICLFGGALLGAGLVSEAAADLTYNGALTQSSTLFGYDYATGSPNPAWAYGPTGFDYFTFNVLTDSQVQIDILSWGVFDSWIGSAIYLFESEDGIFLDSYDWTASSSSGTVGGDLNGSINFNDAFMDLFLEAGEYTVLISSGAGISDLQHGFSNGLLYGTPGLGVPSSGQFQLDVVGNVAAVPSPAVMSLLMLSSLGLTKRRR